MLTRWQLIAVMALACSRGSTHDSGSALHLTIGAASIPADGIGTSIIHVTGTGGKPVEVSTSLGLLTGPDGRSARTLILYGDGDVVLNSGCSAATDPGCAGKASIRASLGSSGAESLASVNLVCPGNAMCGSGESARSANSAGEGDADVHIITESTPPPNLVTKTANTSTTLPSRTVVQGRGRTVRRSLDGSLLNRIQRATALVLINGGSGSAFLVGTFGQRSLLVTNAHVLTPPEGKSFWGVSVVFDPGTPSESDRVKAEVLGKDPDNDLALLAVPLLRDNRPGLSVARTCDAAVGGPIRVAGYPFGTDFSVGAKYPVVNLNNGHVTTGTRGRALLELDVGINPGNSGGPVVDEAGTVLGVAVANVRGTERSFAIPCLAIHSLVAQYAPGFTLDLRNPVTTTPAAELTADDSEVDPGIKNVMARLITSSGRGWGFVAAHLGDQLIVVTADVAIFRVVIGNNIEVTVGGERTPRPGKILFLEPGLALVSVPNSGVGIKPPILGDSVPRPTAAVQVLGFDPTSEEKDWALLWEIGTITSVRTGEDKLPAVLQIDFGIHGGLLGGPVFDESGIVIAVARARQYGTNVSMAVPGWAMLELLARACRLRAEQIVQVKTSEIARGEDVQRAFERGVALVKGDGVPRSYDSARKIFETNCASNHGASCWALSLLLNKGLGIQRDEERARTLLRKACALGSKDGCLDLLKIFDDC